MSLNSLAVLRYLSDFWSKMYGHQSSVIYSSVQAINSKLQEDYFFLLSRVLPPSIANIPIFQEKFWDVIYLTQRDKKFFLDGKEVEESICNSVSYRLDDNYYSIPFLFEGIFDPKLMLIEGDSEYVLQSVTSLVVGDSYINEYNTPIECGTDTVQPGEIFTALSTEFTALGEGSGGVYRNFDYYIRRNTEVTGLLITNSPEIIFRYSRDPLNLTSVKYFSDDTSYLGLFAPKSYIDLEEIFNYFGAAIGIASSSSIQYRNFVEGLMQLYGEGPSLQNLNVGLNVSYGYPVTREDEILVKVYVEPDEFIIRSNKGNIYSIPRQIVKRYDPVNPPNFTYIASPELIFNNTVVKNPVTNQNITNGDFTDTNFLGAIEGYDIYFPVKAFSGFLKDLRVVDYKSEPKWWLQAVSSLNYQMAEGLPDEFRSKPVLIDYMFEKYYKYNTLGVFIKTEVLTDFEGIRDFFTIFRSVKGAAKTFIITDQGLFIVSEMDSGETTGSVSTKVGFEIMTIHDLEIRVGMDLWFMQPDGTMALQPVLPTTPIHEMGSAYDQVGLSLEMLGITSTYDIGDGPEIDSNQYLFGTTVNQGVFVSVHFQADIGVDGDIQSELEFEDFFVGIAILDSNPYLTYLFAASGFPVEDTSGRNNDLLEIDTSLTQFATQAIFYLNNNLPSEDSSPYENDSYSLEYLTSILAYILNNPNFIDSSSYSNDGEEVVITENPVSTYPTVSYYYNTDDFYDTSGFENVTEEVILEAYPVETFNTVLYEFLTSDIPSEDSSEFNNNMLEETLLDTDGYIFFYDFSVDDVTILEDTSSNNNDAIIE